MPMSSSRRRSFGSYARTRSSAWNNKTTRRSSSSRTARSTGSTGTGYRQLQTELQQKINSFRVLYSQTQSGGSFRPARGTLNTFANWINKGAVLHTVSPSQLNRWSDTGRPCTTTGTAKNVLCQKFGRGPIKAVCKSRTGSFIVATAPTFKGRSFKFPNT